jgi:hypothetical protein
MAKRLSVRLPWHDRGWDGHVCDRPTANVFCTGEYGLKAHGIREGNRMWKRRRSGQSRVPSCPSTNIVESVVESLRRITRQEFDQGARYAVMPLFACVVATSV